MNFVIAIIERYKRALSGLSREVWIISLLMLIARSGLMVMPFLAIYLTDILNFTIIQAGSVVTWFGLGSVCASLLGGVLTDRFGYKRVMQFSLLTGGICFWMLIYAHTYLEFSILFFLCALLSDLMRPAVMSSITLYSTEANRTRAISLLRMAINLGISIGPLIGGILIIVLDYNWLFIVNGGMLVITFIVFTLILPQMKEKVFDAKEIVFLESPLAPTAYQDYNYLYLVFLTLLMVIGFIQIVFAIPLFFKSVYQLSELEVGIFFTINGLMIVVLEMPIVEYFESKRQFLKPIVAGGLLMTIAMLSLLIPTGSFNFLWLIPFSIYTVCISLGEILNLPFFNSLSLARSTPQNNGSYMGLFSMIFSASFIIAPKIGSYIIEYMGFDALWIFSALLCLVSTILFVWSKDRFLINENYK